MTAGNGNDAASGCFTDVYHQCYTWYCCSIADRGWRLLCGNNYSAYYYSRSFRCEKDRYFERSLIINLSKLIWYPFHTVLNSWETKS